MMLSPLVLVVALALQQPPAPPAPPSPRPVAAGRADTDRTINVPKGTKLVLTNDGGDITVKAWDRDAVRLQAHHSSRMQVISEIRGQELTIGASHDRVSSSIDYELTVPAWMAIRLEGHYSDIDVEGVAGRVSVETVEGDVMLRNLAGETVAKSIEGSITLEGGRGKSEVTTVEGDIKITKAAGDIVAETTDGGVTLTDVQSSYVSASTVDGDIKFIGAMPGTSRYEFTSHDGDVVLAIPESSKAEFVVRTFSDENRVHTTLPIKASGEVRKGRRVTYTLGGGGGALVEVETFDGSFYVRKPGEVIKKDDND